MSASGLGCASGAHEVVFVAPALMGGGAERVACTLAGYCVDHDVPFTFLLTRCGKVDYDLPAGVEVEDVSRGGSLSPLGQIRAIRRSMHKHPVATFLSFLPYQNMYTLLAGLGLKNRVVISVRNDPSHDFAGNRLLERLRNRLYSLADSVVFQTYEESEAFPDSVREIGTFILNPLAPSTPTPYVGLRDKAVCASGRLTAQKNYPMALKAFAEFSQSHPGYTFEVFGTSHAEFDSESQDSELANLASSLGIGDKVVFHGFSGDANERIRTSAIFVMASRYEGLSNSMLEALSMGVPCVCTRCGGGGPEMVIEDGVNGFLVDVDDVETMAERMGLIVDDEVLSRRLSSEAAKLRDSLDPEKIGAQWLSIL